MDQQPLPPEQPKNDVPQPVAYDSQGRPLYAAPPQAPLPQQPAPQVVHMARAVEPIKQTVSPVVKARHDQSMREFPFLNLSESEFVISAVRRHPIGLVLPVSLTIFLVALTAAILISYPLITASATVGTMPDYGTAALIGCMLIILFLIGGYIAVWVYINNKFFLTNESVIQEIQTTLFARHEQTVSLANIEDASFTQHGILQTMLNYGAIRLSTEGDETTYRFHYVTNPKQQIATLNNAVEAFKNGRPFLDE